AWSLDVDLIERDHVAPEDHRLQVEATALGQEARHPLEEVPVDPLLTPGAVLLGRAEVLEGAEARRGVESAEGLRVDLARVREVDIEAMPAAGLVLCSREGHADAAGTAGADEVEQRPPPASQVQHARAGRDPDLLGHVLVLAPLCLLEGE